MGGRSGIIWCLPGEIIKGARSRSNCRSVGGVSCCLRTYLRARSIPGIRGSGLERSRCNRRSDCLRRQRRGKRWGCLPLNANVCWQGANLWLSRVRGLRGLRSGQGLISCLLFPETISCLGTGFGSSDLIATLLAIIFNLCGRSNLGVIVIGLWRQIGSFSRAQHRRMPLRRRGIRGCGRHRRAGGRGVRRVC